MNSSLRPPAGDGESARESQGLTVVPLPPRRRRRWRRVIAGVLLVIAFAWFTPSLINLAWLGFRPQKMEQWMSRAMGRPVRLNQVHLQLLPVPGFTAGSDNVTGLVIADDPAFGSEPVLRAQRATATLRLSSLWRGRTEIASLTLKNASLNLVRAGDGHWNVERLLIRAAEVATAPTSKKLAEARVRFPYIEASEARVNLKLGAEKTPFVLTDTEFALWLPTENRWNLRIEGVPLRTDQRISDTGRVRVSGSFDRAARLEDLPFHLNVSYEKAQLGQLSALFYGHDRGWWGSVEFNGEIAGTWKEFTATTEASISDFHRYDIVRAGEVGLSAKCNWTALGEGTLSGDCSAPIGGGSVTLTVKANRGFSLANGNLKMALLQVPAAAAMQFAGHSKAGLPDDLSAEGTLDGAVSLSDNSWVGELRAHGFSLQSSASGVPLRMGDIRLEVTDSESLKSPGKASPPAQTAPILSTPALHLPPVHLDLDGTQSAVLSGKATSEGYEFLLAGSADLPRLLEAARLAGVKTPANGAIAGSISALQAHFSGTWAGFAPPSLRVSATLSAASVPVRGIAEPLAIASANVELTQQHVAVTGAHASFAKSGVALNGDLAFDRQCTAGTICNLKFRVLADDLAVEQVRSLLFPAGRTGPFAFLSGGSQADLRWLLDARGDGAVTVRALRFRKSMLADAHGRLSLTPGKVSFIDIQGSAFSGSLRSQATLDFSGPEPVFKFAGTLDRCSVEQLADAVGDRWGAGALHLDYQLHMSGRSADDLRRSANGSGSFVWRNGALAPMGIEPVHFKSWNGGLALRSGEITFTTNSMDGLPGVNAVTGSVNLDHRADLLIRRGTTLVPIQGSLRLPEPVAVTQASK